MSKEEICFYYYFSFSLPEYQIVFVFLKLVAALCVCVSSLQGTSTASLRGKGGFNHLRSSREDGEHLNTASVFFFSLAFLKPLFTICCVSLKQSASTWPACAGWSWRWPSSCQLEAVRLLWTRTGSQVSSTASRRSKCTNLNKCEATICTRFVRFTTWIH